MYKVKLVNDIFVMVKNLIKYWKEQWWLKRKLKRKPRKKQQRKKPRRKNSVTVALESKYFEKLCKNGRLLWYDGAFYFFVLIKPAYDITFDSVIIQGAQTEGILEIGV